MLKAILRAATATLLLNLPYVAHAANVCLLFYQMADNNLEVFLREDLVELVQSTGIQDERLTTWVYFDGRDRNNQNDFYISMPLEQVWTSDGSEQPSSKYDGSQYFHYRHDLQKMVVDQQLGELDGDHPQTLYDFMVHALSDCVTNQGSDEFMLVLSSHGTGFAGYGGDDNDRRRLVQSNANIANVISTALSTVDGAPSQLDVVGFDACLMSSVLALQEYQDVAKYVLASEATEPGHGWAYKSLSNVNSALEMATSLHDNFLRQRQGESHQAPKTMALVETSSFTVFSGALEALFAELETRLAANDDADFHALLQRARASSVAFESYLDDTGTANPSAVDVGSFLSAFSELCEPPPSSTLGQRLQEAEASYSEMFVSRGIGPGTPKATGMHIMFPMKNAYQSNQRLFNGYLFQNPHLDLPPQWLSFMQTYLATKSPSSDKSNSESICGMTTVASGGSTETATTIDSETVPTTSDDGTKLLIDPRVEVLDDTPTFSGLKVHTEITTSTDLVSVEVGIDSSALVARRRRRLWGDNIDLAPPQKSNLLEQMRPINHVGRRRRHLQETNNGEDYFLLYLGTVAGTYNQSQFSAVWDGEFFFLGDTQESPVPVYVYDEGNGARSVPVMYFPPSSRIGRNSIPVGTTLEQAVTMGATFGALKFGYNSTSRELTTAFTLMTDDTSTSSSGVDAEDGTNGSNNTSTKSETLPSVGGQVVPILFLDGRVDGYDYSMFLGGFDRTIFDWSEDNPMEIQLVSASRYLDTIPSVNTLVVNLRASDFDAETTEAAGQEDEVTFRIHVSGGTARTRPFWVSLFGPAVFVFSATVLLF